MPKRMDIAQYNNAKSGLLLAFNLVAPTGVEQRKMVDIVHRMELGGRPYEAVLVAIANAIVDIIVSNKLTDDEEDLGHER